MASRRDALRGKADLRGSLSFVVQRLVPFRKPIGLHRASGLRFRFGPRDVVGRTILRYQDYEPAISASLFGRLRAARSPGLFVDVGANIGWFTLHAARMPAVEQVLAFEPDPGNHALLCENVDLNGLTTRILPVSCALGAERSLAVLNRYGASNPGRHSLLHAYGQGHSLVAVETLDGVLEHLGHGHTPIRALKLDVEGLEPAVVAGARRALARTDLVVIELSRTLSERGGLDFRGMISDLAKAGFAAVSWDRAGEVPDLAALERQAEQCTVLLARGPEGA